MTNRTEKETPAQAAGEYFRMPPKNAMQIGTPQQDERTARAFSAAADAQNGAFAQNTSAQD